jgi:hypothetical protein
MSNDRNADGKRHDGLNPYRLVITIIRGDARSEVMTRMARGTIVGHGTIDDAVKAQDEFHRLCAAVKADDLFATYGMTCIIDTTNGAISYPRNLD